jgi:SpoIID/LytB domain protein
VLVRKDGSLVTTVYSAMCGGHTEDNDAVWPVEADPNLRGHLDGNDRSLARYRRGIDDKNIEAWLQSRPTTWCSRSSYNKDKYRWTTRIPRARVDQLVRGLGVGRARALRVKQRGRSGRANLIAVQGTRATREVRGEYRIRQLFGGLRSAMFLVRQKGDAFDFTGGGWGHGVGMCQTGATGMAQAGKTFRAILGHYYPGSELQPLY